MATETLSLSTNQSTPFSLRPWLIGWGIVLAVLTILLANDGWGDTAAWRATRWLLGSQDSYNWDQYKLPPAGGWGAPMISPFPTSPGGQRGFPGFWSVSRKFCLLGGAGLMPRSFFP